MRAAVTLFLRCCCLLMAGAPASPLRGAGGADSRCTQVCAEMAARIRADPRKLVMAVEDALVTNESCTVEIIATAIDAVNADQARVQRIWQCAVKIVPHRVFEIQKAVAGFHVPRAGEFKEPPLEVRRAQTPDAHAEPVHEVRRAEAPHESRPTPIAEVRRAESADPKNAGPIIEVKRAEVAAKRNVMAEEVRGTRPADDTRERLR